MGFAEFSSWQLVQTASLLVLVIGTAGTAGATGGITGAGAISDTGAGATSVTGTWLGGDISEVAFGATGAGS